VKHNCTRSNVRLSRPCNDITHDVSIDNFVQEIVKARVNAANGTISYTGHNGRHRITGWNEFEESVGNQSL
jgi:hypothetical protein